jgi:DNA-binding MarR family transcriptional regulator
MAKRIDPTLMDALRELPPLFPRFLQRRRVGLPVVGELASELGVERPLIFVLVQIDMVQGAYDRKGVTLPELQASDPYFVVDRFSRPIAELKERGFASESSEGLLSLSVIGQAAVERLQAASTAYVAGRVVLPIENTERLANELRRAADAIAADPWFAPFPGRHLAGYRALARYGDHAAPMVSIEQAIMELWGARDDAFTATWRAEDMEGPPLDVLSHIWSGLNTLDEITQALKLKQTPGDIESSLAWLVEREYVERDGDLRPSSFVSLTPKGVMVREDIENETDRLYFAPWPHTIDEVAWVRDRLNMLVEKLSAPL